MGRATEQARIFVEIGRSLDSYELSDGAINAINAWMTTTSERFDDFSDDGVNDRLAVISNPAWRRKGLPDFSSLLGTFTGILVEKCDSANTSMISSAMVTEAIGMVSASSGTYLCNPDPKG